MSVSEFLLFWRLDIFIKAPRLFPPSHLVVPLSGLRSDQLETCPSPGVGADPFMGGLEEEAEMGREQVSMAPSLQQPLLEAVGNPSSELAPCCVPACRCGLSLLQPHMNQNQTCSQTPGGVLQHLGLAAWQGMRAKASRCGAQSHSTGHLPEQACPFTVVLAPLLNAPHV